MAEVLTLPGIAEYLRVSEGAVLTSVGRGALPARQIGGEWRFLKSAVTEWLNSVPDFTDVSRTLSRSPTFPHQSAKPGSREAVLEQFGAFQGGSDLEEQLASMSSQRKPKE